MIVDEIIFLALKSILRNKTRSALTMLGIIIGVAAVILLTALGQGIQKYVTDQFESLGTNLVFVLPGKFALTEGQFAQGPPNFAGSKLTLKHIEDLRKMGDIIEDATGQIEMPSSVKYKSESKFTTIEGVSANFGKLFNFKVANGRDITDSDVNLSRKVAVLGKGLVEDLFGASDALGKEISIGNGKFEVIGILEEIGTGGIGFDVNEFVAIPITTAQNLFGQDSIQTIAVKIKSKEDIADAKKIIENYLLKDLDENEFTVIDQSSLLTTINNILGVLTLFLGGIAGISLVVGGVGIMNIMLVSVTERTREIGLRKAVGARPQDILIQFLVESVVLSILGGIIGILIGAGGAALINKFITTSVTWWAVGLAFGVSAAVGIIFGVAPAIRASRLNAIDALRYE